MAFEKECDVTLRLLCETFKVYHPAVIADNLLKKGFSPSAQDVITIITILTNDDHIIANSVSATTEDNNIEFHGSLKVTKTGVAFINNIGYENQKSKEDLLMDLNISNRKIQTSLLYINRWIAFGGIAVALASILEIIRNYYNPLLPFFVYILYPLLATLFLIWISFKGLQLLQERRNKKQSAS